MNTSRKLTAALILTLLLTAGGCTTSSSPGADDEVIRVGIRNSEQRTWAYLQEVAAEEGIQLELVEFNSSVDPNQILLEGDIDLNAFQHLAYLRTFNENHDEGIVPIGTTIIAPLGLYSNTITEIDELPDNGKIALPNDSSNWGRALVLLEDAGIIELTDDFNGLGGEDKIKSNPKKLEIIAVDAGNTPRAMEDVDAAIINNGVAVEAGLSLSDAVIHEDETAEPYINVIAALEDRKDDPTFARIVELYQSEETAAFINETYGGNYLPTSVSLEAIAFYQEMREGE